MFSFILKSNIQSVMNNLTEANLVSNSEGATDMNQTNFGTLPL